METGNRVDPSTCQVCGLCVAVCPAAILKLGEDKAGQPVVQVRAERVSMCMQCGQCMAICPSQSIFVNGLSYQRDFFDLPTDQPDAHAFFDMLSSRRSIRVFKDRAVPREALERIVQAISMAPCGFTPHKTQICIVQSRETIEQALPVIVKTYESLGRLMAKPASRFVMRHRMSPENFSSLNEHVLPGMKYRLPDMKAGKGDTITRGAPAMLLFHADRQSGGHSGDAYIALTYGVLAAHALGLGASAISLVPPVVERSPELRRLFDIPSENEVLACMIVGYARYRFQRGIRRQLAGVTWID
jgi:NAD-dependent dihydropyrimidine dehydrogenase PreA subunit/nitroreductase